MPATPPRMIEGTFHPQLLTLREQIVTPQARYRRTRTACGMA